MDEMATNTEYILRMVLELIDKCKTLENFVKRSRPYLTKANKKGSAHSNKETATQHPKGEPEALLRPPPL